MAIKINFDSSGLPETPTFIVSKRNGDHIGVINTATKIHVKDNLNSFSEFSFSVFKTLNDTICEFWDEINNLRLMYIPEWEKWFEIYVEIDEDNSCIKNITAKSLQEAELSQIRLHEIEINTEKDIAKDNYQPTVLYNINNANASLLHRLLVDKTQHYKIFHVDDSIAKKQRSFSFDNKSIYDAFCEISEELHCLFIYGESDGINKIPRTISVYDLESNCNNCGYRGEYMGICPECGSFDIKEGYGHDTTIFVSNENLAEGIVYSTDIDSVKNCFRFEAGDDEMTAAIVNINPSGSRYIWYIPEYMKRDMSQGLIDKLNSYDNQVKYYETSYKEAFDPFIIDKYNQLIDKYKIYKDSLDHIITPITGYQNLIKIYYDVIDFKGYLENSLMPNVELSDTSLSQQVKLLTSDNLSPVSVENISYISLSTANSIILSYAKVFIDTSKYKIKVKSSNLSNNIWTGIFTVTSYTNDEDTIDSSSVTIQLNDDYENFTKQKIDKILTKENEDLSIVGLFKKNDTNFKNELKKYGLSSLKIIYDACQACIDILIEQGISDMRSDLYEKIYKPYRNKLTYISQELKLRESEIAIVDATYDKDGDVIENGIKSLIEKKQTEISKILDFKKFLGDYWNEFCSFRREDLWKNGNYISEGLDNAQLFKQANEFLNAAKKDLVKSSTLQHSISTTLKNLLIIDSFKPLIKHFSVGNWLRISIDEKIYKLRLISYEINYDDLDTISVEFSDVIDAFGIISDIESILKQSQSINNTYDSTKHQAEEGEKASGTLKGWVGKGLEATTAKIMNNSDDQDYVFDRHGMVFRKKDPITDTYSPTQIKIINSTLAMTNDNWMTSKVGIGEFIYLDPRDWKYKTGYGVIADTLIGNLILGEEIGIYNDKGTMTFKEDGLTITNDINTFKVNPNSKTLLTLLHDDKRILYVDETGELHIIGDGSALDITANNTVKGMNTKITQNSANITLEANRATEAEGKLSASIKVNAEAISLRVEKNEFGSYMEQYYDHFLIGFNNDSKYIQINPGEIGIYDNDITNNKKRAAFDQNGNHFYRDGYYIGKIGTNSWKINENHKGLVFDLEYDGKYMSFAKKSSPNATEYTTVWTFSRENSIYDYEGMWSGVDIYLNNNNFYLGKDQNNRINAYSEGMGLTSKHNIYLRIDGVNKSTISSDGLQIPSGSGLTAFNNTYLNFYSDLNMHNFDILNNSDERLKKNIIEPENALEKILNLDVFQYDWRDTGKHVSMGLIAQQVNEIIPEVIHISEQTGLYSIKTHMLIPYLIRSIQELYDTINDTTYSISKKYKTSYSKSQIQSALMSSKPYVEKNPTKAKPNIVII